MSQLLDRFARQLHRLDVRPGDRVLVAVSGGLDSIVLLDLFRQVAPAARLDLRAAHFDHAMRPGSASDASWVKEQCAAWQIPIHAARSDSDLNSEAAARSARYAFLERTADHVGAQHIATGHHADDQAETVLFRVMRGTGIDGLAGIPERRGRVVRPLLFAPRARLEAYARERGLAWREDESNLSPRFARNRIRHELLPALEEMRPGVRRGLLRLARDARRARAGWERVVGGVEKVVVKAQDATAIELARPALLEYHRSIRVQLLRRCVSRLGGSLGRAGTGALQTFISSSGSGSGIDLGGGIRAERDFDTIRLHRVSRERPADQPLTIEKDGGRGVATIGGKPYEVCWSIDGTGEGDFIEVDASAVQFPLVVRSWQPGDRIRLSFGSKKLKKLFAERRVARAKRHEVPVLADRTGEVLWVVGLDRASSVGAQPANGSGFRIMVRDGQSG